MRGAWALAGGQGGGHQGAAGADVAQLAVRVGLEAARQVFAYAAGRIGVRRPPGVMSGVVVGRLDAEQVARPKVDSHAQASQVAKQPAPGSPDFVQSWRPWCGPVPSQPGSCRQPTWPRLWATDVAPQSIV